MLRRLRENGPVVLVPLAWSFVTAAHLDLVAIRTLLNAHVVMDAILLSFVALSWSDMTAGILRAWRTAILVGLGLTLVGTAGLVVSPPIPAALAVTVLGWMVVPGAGLAYTGRRVDATWAYGGGALLCALGAVAYAAGLAGVATPASTLFGLALVGVGQTAGIADAVYRY